MRWCTDDSDTRHVASVPNGWWWREFRRVSEKRRPSVTAVPKLDLPKRLPRDDLYEPRDAPLPEESSEPMKKRLIRGQALTAMPSFRRIHTLAEGRPSDIELDAAAWLLMYVQDAWQVQARAMLHVCGPSCWKYNKTGTRFCRHHCYHITVLEPDDTSSVSAEKPIKLRRDGRPLNNQLYIICSGRPLTCLCPVFSN